MCLCSLSCVQLFAIPLTVACQAPLSMKFSRQEYWNRLPFRSPEDLPNTDSNPSPIILTFVEIRSQEWILQGYNHRVVQLCSFLKFQGRICSLSLPASRECLHSFAYSFITPTPASIITSPSLTLALLPPPFTFKDTCVYIVSSGKSRRHSLS